MGRPVKLSKYHLDANFAPNPVPLLGRIAQGRSAIHKKGNGGVVVTDTFPVAQLAGNGTGDFTPQPPGPKQEQLDFCAAPLRYACYL